MPGQRINIYFSGTVSLIVSSLVHLYENQPPFPLLVKHANC